MRKLFILKMCLMLLFLFCFVLSAIAQEDTSAGILAWSPDGEMIAIAHEDYVQIIEVTTGNLIYSTPNFTENISGVVWSPNSNQLAIAVGREVQIWDIETKQALMLFREHQDEIISMSWSPNGEKMLSSSRQNALIWELATGTVLHQFTHDPGPLLSAIWSPDGTRIATTGLDSQILFWDSETGLLLGGISIPRQTGIVSVNTMAWNVDGSLLAAASSDMSLRIWDGVNNHPSEINAFLALTDMTTTLAWNPNNVDLARAGLNGEISIWDSQIGNLISMTRVNVAVKALAYSPYGGRLAYGSHIADDNALSSSDANTENLEQVLAHSGVRIIVPDASIERLESIAQNCNLPTSRVENLNQAEQLANFVRELEATESSEIPPSCAADLLAIAQALQSNP